MRTLPADHTQPHQLFQWPRCEHGRECCTFIIQQHVLRFEVSVDDPLLVEMLQALNDLGHVVARAWLIESWVVLVHVINVISGMEKSERERPNLMNKR